MKQTEKASTKRRSKVNKSAASKRDEFRIRRARMTDLKAVVGMSSAVSEIENYPGQKMKKEDFVHFVRGHGSTMLVAVAAGETIGYVTIYESENYFYLPYAVTKKQWRSRGVGSALLREVERLASGRNVDYILMSVYAYNSSVHKFLKARGYVASKKLVQYSKIISGRGKR